MPAAGRQMGAAPGARLTLQYSRVGCLPALGGWGKRGCQVGRPGLELCREDERPRPEAMSPGGAQSPLSLRRGWT